MWFVLLVQLLVFRYKAGAIAANFVQKINFDLCGIDNCLRHIGNGFGPVNVHWV